jgi:hypothetical protein
VRSRSLTLVPLAALAVTLLAGCTFSVGVNTAPTVPAEDVETLAADELEELTGVRPDIDCGDERIPVEVDTSVTCLLIDPVAGLEFDVVLSFTEVQGTVYSFDIKVADVPNNAPEPTVEPTDPANPEATVTGDDIAALVVQALTPSLGYPPAVNCPEPEIDVVVGNTTYCQYDDVDAVSHDVEVEFTFFDGTSYEVSVTPIS